ncbi:MAG: hypothetical protein M3Y24_04675 [Acidobacteriota bacterium]|nr:hypothetical protein [Acidobacteriota bacterium]
MLRELTNVQPLSAVLRSLDAQSALRKPVSGSNESCGHKSQASLTLTASGQNYTKEMVELVRDAGFVYACAASHGTPDSRTDRYQLPRMMVRN